MSKKILNELQKISKFFFTTKIKALKSFEFKLDELNKILLTIGTYLFSSLEVFRLTNVYFCASSDVQK